MKRFTDRLPAGTLFILLAAIVFLLILFGCVPTRERCEQLYPPQESTSDTSWRTFEPDTIQRPADSSWSEYLVECQETAQGLRAVIVRLMGQGAGQVILPPVAVIDSTGRMTVKAEKPAEKVPFLRPHDHTKQVKNIVYVKITNIKTGLEWFQIWGFRFVVILGILAAIFFVVKNKWYTILINLGISLVNKFKKKK